MLSEKARRVLDKVEETLSTVTCEDYRRALINAVRTYRDGTSPMHLFFLLMLRRFPVTMREFIYGQHYLNMGASIYPKIVDELVDLNNPDGDRLGLKHYEGVWTGGIGTGKTTQALITTAYQLYLLSCYRNPHEVLQQDKSAEILFIFQSLNGKVAKDVDYKRFRAMVENTPYFNYDFPYRKDILSRLMFPNRIEVLPVTGDVTATIGQNVYGGVMDEVNFMDVIQDSARRVDGGMFDQAKELYNSLSSRRSSRFMTLGCLPGIFCLMSSKHYPGQFTDRKYEESKTDPGIWYFDKTVWEVKDDTSFSGKWFEVFTGDIARKPYIISENNRPPNELRHMIKRIPAEYRNKFEIDIYNALREIAGVSTLAKTPFIPNIEKIALFMERGMKIESPFSQDKCDFETTQMEIDFTKFTNPKRIHYAHIDLGLTSDSAGVCIGHVPKFDRVQDEGVDYYMPHIRIDALLCVRPPPNNEINFAKIRRIMLLVKGAGINLRYISFDSYQSVDSMQILRSHGFATGTVSMDTTPLPYDMAKEAILQERITSPHNEHLHMELVQLERTDKGKIDHPPSGSKDLADAFAGVVYGLTTRLDVWAQHGLPINQQLIASAKKAKMKEDAKPSIHIPSL